ncbi:MAG: hypothetical protein NVSMB60_27860 [Mycobacterium sp.]
MAGALGAGALGAEALLGVTVCATAVVVGITIGLRISATTRNEAVTCVGTGYGSDRLITDPSFARPRSCCVSLCDTESYGGDAVFGRDLGRNRSRRVSTTDG